MVKGHKNSPRKLNNPLKWPVATFCHLPPVPPACINESHRPINKLLHLRFGHKDFSSQRSRRSKGWDSTGEDQGRWHECIIHPILDLDAVGSS